MEIAGGELRREGALAPGFQDKFHECDCPEKVRAYNKTYETDAKRWAMGHAWETLLGSPCFDVCNVFAFFLSLFSFLFGSGTTACGEFRWEGARWKRQQCGRRGNRGK